jgi:hypothetical protein
MDPESAPVAKKLTLAISEGYRGARLTLSHGCHANVTIIQRVDDTGSKLAQSRVNDFICILLQFERLPAARRRLYS